MENWMTHPDEVQGLVVKHRVMGVPEQLAYDGSQEGRVLENRVIMLWIKGVEEARCHVFIFSKKLNHYGLK